ncbi:hypothetical protein JTE90_009046 [Oedothorax gibbosus]|uniref:MARVEL domain-containing protein n=1 Tax=Oedothorax gibbosus TaxID=931172 RepID=A0AAV6VIF0_9ARAC|nr:hypothetical protein JTE90_009046 [Oedothorax gibbosus]
MFPPLEMKQNTKLLGWSSKYISTFQGILNVCQIVLSCVSIHLLRDTCRPAYSSSSGGFVGSAHETYFYLCSFASLVITCVLLFSFSVSHMSFMLAEKTIVCVVLWSTCFLLSFLTSLVLFLYVNAANVLEVFGYSHKIAAAILGFINSGLYLINALKTYRSCKSSWSYLCK